MTIIWSREAADDFESSVRYLAARNPAAAARVAHGILNLIERLAGEPIDGPEHLLSTGQTVRGWAYPPFRVYYLRSENTLQVIRIYHQRRRPL